MQKSFLSLALASIALSLACTSQIGDRPHLLLLTLDTTRADHLGCYGYFRETTPVLDSLAARSVLFEDCITTMSTTLPAHASILTGLYPIDHGVFANLADGGQPLRTRDGIRSLAELLSDEGYETGAFVSAAPLSELTGIAAGFRTYDEPDEKERTARETITRALAWLDATSGPTFTWIHLFEPHSPYLPQPPFHRMFRSDDELAAHMQTVGITPLFESEVRRRDNRETFNAYDGEIRAMDAAIGRLLARLHETGRSASTVIAIVGDHGEGLAQHGRWSHGDVWHEQINVPAFFAGPGIVPARIQTTMSVIDFLPTVLTQFSTIPAGRYMSQARGEDVLSAQFQPRPVVSQISDRRVRKFEASVCFALTTEEWKIVYTRGEPTQVYARRNDPHERDDRASQQGELVHEFEPVARYYTSSYDSLTAVFAGQEAVAVPDDHREKMRALGYVD